jgi:putative tryptophan/tyrosine transport system substrate-binding protein
MSVSTMIQRAARALLFVGWLAPVAAAVPASGEGAGSLVIVTSRDDGPYEGVVSGLRAALGDSPGGRGVRLHSLQSGTEAALGALRDARNGDAPLMVTVGSVATRSALEARGDAPLVACMIVDEDNLGSARNATGVMLEIPLETQLEWVRRFLPATRTIGVLYNPQENWERIQEAGRIASRLGLRLIAQEVIRPQDLPGALDHVGREADLLFGMMDHMVLSRQTSQAILLFSFRNRMPFSGLSASWVKAGALYALERDYKDLGAQCGEMALKVLSGKRPSTLPPATPRKLVYAVNLKTAEHLKLSLPPALVEGAAELFR